MRLLITIGYTKLVLSKEANYSAVVEALSTATAVKEAGPWESRVLAEDDSKSIEMAFIADDAVKPAEVVDALGGMAAERETLRKRITELEAQLKQAADAAELEAQLKQAADAAKLETV